MNDGQFALPWIFGFKQLAFLLTDHIFPPRRISAEGRPPGEPTPTQQLNTRNENNKHLQEHCIFLGNPGAGKSTLINCLIGKQICDSGISHGQGLTTYHQQVVVDGIAYMDTPGLADIRIQEQAAKETTMALKKSEVKCLVPEIESLTEACRVVARLPDHVYKFDGKWGTHDMVHYGGSNKTLGWIALVVMIFLIFWTAMNRIMTIYPSTACLKIAVLEVGGKVPKDRAPFGSLDWVEHRDLKKHIDFFTLIMNHDVRAFPTTACSSLRNLDLRLVQTPNLHPGENKTKDKDASITRSAGKSTLINCLIGAPVFESGISHGEGITKFNQQAIVDGIAYMDTPGLADVRIQEQAAEQITMALKKSGKYKLFFLVRLQAGRIVNEDLTTLERVLDAIKVNDLRFSVVINSIAAWVSFFFYIFEHVPAGLRFAASAFIFIEVAEQGNEGAILGLFSSLVHISSSTGPDASSSWTSTSPSAPADLAVNFVCNEAVRPAVTTLAEFMFFGLRDSVGMSVREHWIFLGNPGAGKSTLINCLIGRQVFDSGTSHGQGLTIYHQQVQVDGIAYMDTPGLADVRIEEQAAEQITMALKKSGKYKLFFLVRLQAGRIISEDLATMERVLEAIKVEELNYSVVINNMSKVPVET
ncbi:hypothetical protein ATCC90586_003074 [Pythium insidiosum]|nr:hypothetical protein ATCC90586_003074 [Pythium insidiosum]